MARSCIICGVASSILAGAEARLHRRVVGDVDSGGGGGPATWGPEAVAAAGVTGPATRSEAEETQGGLGTAEDLDSKALPAFDLRNDVILGPRLDAQTEGDVENEWKLVALRKPPEETKTKPLSLAEMLARGPGAAASARPPKPPPAQIEALGPLQFRPAPEENGGPAPRLVRNDFAKINQFAAAVRDAFYKHYPLRLTPDVIWLTIVQGLCSHIAKDPEKHRAAWNIQFEGQKTLIVNRPGFVKGSRANDWTTVFPQFAEMIDGFIGSELGRAAAADFSTSDQTSQICAQIALMDTVQHYFKYQMMCGCGIPSIQLAGTAGDWTKLYDKATVLLGGNPLEDGRVASSRFEGLEFWTADLFPVLQHFVDAAKGHPDLRFWNSVVSRGGASRPTWVEFTTGWLQVFWPYLQGGRQNPLVGAWVKHYMEGTGNELSMYNRDDPQVQKWRKYFVGSDDPEAVKTGAAIRYEQFPSGISQAPVDYKDNLSGASYKMSFNAGIVGVVQHDNLTLEPVLSWAVLDHTASEGAHAAAGGEGAAGAAVPDLES